MLRRAASSNQVFKYRFLRDLNISLCFLGHVAVDSESGGWRKLPIALYATNTLYV